MTWREAEKILKKLLPRLPADFAVHKRLLFFQPVNSILRGFYLDRSSDPASFYFYVFAQPLYVPSEDIVFNFGERLGRGWRYEAETEPELLEKLLNCIIDEGLPMLRKMETPAQFAEIVDQIFDPNNAHLLQARAYSLVLAGNHTDAAKVFDKLHDRITRSDDDRLWVRELLRENDALKRLLIRNPAAVEAKLRAWERATLANLKLEKFAAGR